MSKLRKNSSTSSKPPSSDIVKPEAQGNGGKGSRRTKRKPGGQLGHRRHNRQAFSASEIDEVIEYELDSCPDCGGSLRGSKEAPRVIQQVELRDVPVVFGEYRSPNYWCPRCRRVQYNPISREIRKAGLCGPRLTALVGFMKGSCDASYSTIQTFLQDVLSIRISRGQIAKLVQKVSQSVKPAYESLQAGLPGESRLNVDETSHKENGQRLWTWCFRASKYTVYRIDPSRGSDVLFAVLTNAFGGVLGSDYFSAYRKYMDKTDTRVQFCLAHLIRDVRFLTTLRDRVTKNYGERVLNGLRQLFRLIHRRETMTPLAFKLAIERVRDRLVRTVKQAPQRNEPKNIAKRFKKHAAAYFEFITTPDVEPTNNLAEQALRFVVMHRRITQGTRSEKGRRWCERIWTMRATCKQQSRSLFT
ncbi:MAG: IS66 family transposase, partial [Candidatus Binatia bacterium]